MSIAACTFYEKNIYQYENNKFLGVTSELNYPFEQFESEVFILESSQYLNRLEMLVQELRNRAEDAVVEKLTAEVTLKKDGHTEVELYIIVAFRTNIQVSSYWIRKIKYEKIDSNLITDEFLGSLIKNFSYIQCLSKSEIANIQDDSTFLLTPECVQYIEDYFSFNNYQVQEKADEERFLKQMGNGYYVTRILAHSIKNNNLWLYCGTTFRIVNGRREEVIWNTIICLKTLFFSEKRIILGKINISGRKSLINTGKYPWLLLERDND